MRVGCALLLLGGAAVARHARDAAEVEVNVGAEPEAVRRSTRAPAGAGDTAPLDSAEASRLAQKARAEAAAKRTAVADAEEEVAALKKRAAFVAAKMAARTREIDGLTAKIQGLEEVTAKTPAALVHDKAYTSTVVKRQELRNVQADQESMLHDWQAQRARLEHDLVRQVQERDALEEVADRRAHKAEELAAQEAQKLPARLSSAALTAGRPSIDEQLKNPMWMHN